MTGPRRTTAAITELAEGVEAVGQDSYVTFIDEGPTPSGKTRRWTVMNANGHGRLGIIKWYGGWRRYCYFPCSQIVLSAGCMEDIATFIEAKMEARG